MPKQIKKKELPKGEKTSCILGMIAMFMSLALSSLMIFLVQQSSGDKEPKALGIAVFAVYAVFTVVCLIHFLQGLVTFKKQESYAALFTSMLTAVSLFGLLLNVQFMLAMMFSALGKEKIVNKIVGDAGITDFISTQTSAWNLMLAGIAAAFAVGIIDIIRIAKTK